MDTALMHNSFKSFRIVLLTLLFGLVLLHPAVAQDSKKKLEQQKAKIEEEIQYTNKLLDQTQKNKKVTIEQLVMINKQITKREQLIG